MQGIAYIKDNKPYITWPAIHVMLDDDGNPTGEVTSNLDELMVALPEGTEYTLVTEEEAEAWWRANKPEPTTEQLADTARAERDGLIESVRWRIERHNDELVLGREPTEPLEPLLQYVQSLRDVPQQVGFPESVEWPQCP